MILALGTPAHAGAREPAPPSQCEDSIRGAARSTASPLGLMRAIGLVESGRPDSAGAAHPWPWTINAEGKGMFFDTKAAAITAVQVLQAHGVRSIDVGCMQVNLMHHPDAFASLDEAFDPSRNAEYAGRFLRQLFQQSRDWLTAAGLYHSQTPALAIDYTRQVVAVLRGRPMPRVLTAVTPLHAAPLVGPDGTIIPSVRLTSAGLIGENKTGQTPRATAQPIPTHWIATRKTSRLHGS